LSHGSRGGRATWSGGPNSLNGRLDQVLTALEQRIVDDDQAAAEARKRREAFRVEQERRAERARLERIDAAPVKRATAEMSAWRVARDLAEYVAAPRARLPELASLERDRLEGWCDWVEDYAGRSDPVHSTSLVIGFDDETGRARLVAATR
jgi:hypothetical protein